ncbi:MAG TPA: sigma 54-interacting transcriptional regulator [Sandaracinaceae bacterium LLY-WYZ-13_1]|nr:sigma 54-interacting transcriptional regulator [Sandaracinaceae bacterium LLY-WYZ-13_1]
MSSDDDKTTLSQDTVERARRASGPRASLVVYHRDQVKVMPLPPDGELVVGRSWPADVVVDDPSLSRRHACFARLREGVRVHDLGSTNGTHLGGERIAEALLGPGDAVTLGSVTISVNLAAANAPLLEGLESYERFHAHLADEIVRARTFHRPLALVMVRAIGPDDAHASRWVPRLRRTLRPVDRVTLWGETAALILLPESDAARAATVASALVEGDRLGEPTLLAGVGAYGSTAGELLDRARGLCRRARPDQRVVVDAETESPTVPDRPVFASPKMRELRTLVERVASSSIPVLVQGETGSGKEVVARAIHAASPRASGPMRSVNCGAMPAALLESQLFGHEKGAFTGAERTTPGLFEQASGGTLLLDEVGELSAAAQAALLRVLETQRVTRVGGTEEIAVDVRVLCATHRDLEAMVGEGSFRQDLLYRLNTMTLHVPPLRERPEDLEALIDRFFEEATRAGGGRVRGIDPSARAVLRSHGWPGNVRELRNVIERAVVVCAGESIAVEDLPEALRRPTAPAPSALDAPDVDLPQDADFKERVRAYETQLILDALRRTGGNQTQAAKLLRMPLRTLVHKIKTYGIRKQFEAD